jgi:hypothetical protein|tara:strand:+ start:245 stop:745 length:501 start_codon:yes stop_codon:yes gene_type:complete
VSISEIQFPQKTTIQNKASAPYYRDAFKVVVTKHGLEAKQVYHGIFGFIPKPVQWALKLRNALVKWIGFAASDTEMALPLEEIATGKKAGFLVIEGVTEEELVCGAYEKNMDIWLSVLRLSEQEFAISTLVNLKTRSARWYMALIKPFHQRIAKYTIRQALKAGRI